MKLYTKTIFAILVGSSASVLAGTSSAGGLEAAESAVVCHYKSSNDLGYTLDLNIITDASAGAFSAIIQQTSMNGFYEPITLTGLSRTQPSENNIKYSGKGLELSINLMSGQTTFPPQYDAVLKTTSAVRKQKISLQCELKHE